jgi:hypothetical protein
MELHCHGIDASYETVDRQQAQIGSMLSSGALHLGH